MISQNDSTKECPKVIADKVTFGEKMLLLCFFGLLTPKILKNQHQYKKNSENQRQWKHTLLTNAYFGVFNAHVIHIGMYCLSVFFSGKNTATYGRFYPMVTDDQPKMPRDRRCLVAGRRPLRENCKEKPGSRSLENRSLLPGGPGSPGWAPN